MWYNGGMKLRKDFWSFTLKTIVVTGIITVGLIFLISSREIAVALTPWATLLLALAAFWAIWQNRSLQIRERRERLLNEIIEWAIYFTKSRFATAVKDLVGIADRRKQDLFIYSHIVEIQETFVGMSGRNLYIKNVVLEFELGLQKAAAQLIDDLATYIEFLDEWQGAGTDAINDEKSVEKADKHELQLKESANKVIEEATKIKTKGIG